MLQACLNNGVNATTGGRGFFGYGNPAYMLDMMVIRGIGTDGAFWERSKTGPPDHGSITKVYTPCYDITIPNAATGCYRRQLWLRASLLLYKTSILYLPIPSREKSGAID